MKGFLFLYGFGRVKPVSADGTALWERRVVAFFGNPSLKNEGFFVFIWFWNESLGPYSIGRTFTGSAGAIAAESFCKTSIYGFTKFVTDSAVFAFSQKPAISNQ
ncbi:hypothetical protein ACFSKN_18045 [Mariniflexile gromovii]|uniref:Uncharacterized protein n=1 Tax=Mariniflexile gromovii TaxID=362523 RepID=A0ABS4BXB6_9FLAO|nr:hypothetical protein [Mariniflexile gromovii]MBP0905228.1 hypothetical protein [Mariniflexile gromovii]